MRKIEAIRAKEALEHELAKLSRQYHHVVRQLQSRNRLMKAIAPPATFNRPFGWGEQTIDASMRKFLETVKK